MSLGVNQDLQNRLVPGDAKLVQMAEHFDQFIMSHEMANPSVWRDRLPKGTFELFNGLTQKTNVFRGTLGPQQGLANWTVIEPSVKSIGGTPGVDACSYNPQTYSWAMDSLSNTGLKSSWRSPVFCVNDLKYVDQAKQQLAFIIRAGSRVIDDSKEVFNREQYIRTAVSAGKAFVLAEGATGYIDNPAAFTFAYDPFALDANGDTYLTFPAALLPSLSAVNWSFLDYVRQYLADQCPETAIGQESGMPIFSLMIDMLDFDRFVMNTPELRQDFRWATPQQLITGFQMGFKVYRGFALMHDPRQMRFKITKNDGTTVTATRVVPRRATRAGSIGLIPESNPEYINAELGVGVIFMNQIIQILVPPTLSNLGTGMTFGPAPGFNGEWTWINEYDKDTNPLKEVGYFFSRMEFHIKPLIYSHEATVFLYRRCPQAFSTGCGIDTAADVGTGAIGFGTDGVVLNDVTNGIYTVTGTLAKKLEAGLGDSVKLIADDASEYVCNIADASKAPTYVFISSVTFGADVFTAAGASTVTVL